jgi:hypothetical protein
MKPLGQAVGRCLATVILDFNERTTCAITIGRVRADPRKSLPGYSCS